MDLIQFIDEALKEDLQAGDHTSLACIPRDKFCTGQIIAKEAGIVAGVDIAVQVFHRIDPEIKMKSEVHDGESIEVGSLVLLLEGRAQSILKGERSALNFMQRMSGIATLTHRYVQEVEDYPTKILDTRKTTPLFRQFEKLAVQIGGGVNHRMGLYDMIMIKDNHIAYCGGIEQAILTVSDYLKRNDLKLKVEIEAASLEDVTEILSVGQIDRIMLDNFSIDDTKKAVELINGKFETESSGGITLKNVRQYAACGVDYISIGALTHSAKSLDLSLKAL